MKSLKIKRLNENAILPERASAGAAGMDLHACIPSPVTIAPRELVRIPTGLAIALPDENMVALIFARSGLGIKGKQPLLAERKCFMARPDLAEKDILNPSEAIEYLALNRRKSSPSVLFNKS